MVEVEVIYRNQSLYVTVAIDSRVFAQKTVTKSYGVLEDRVRSLMHWCLRKF